MKNLTIDVLNLTNDEDFQYYLDNLFEDEPEGNHQPSIKQDNKQQQQTKTMEQQIKEQITELENTIETKRAELKREFSATTLLEVNSHLAAASDLKTKLKYETELREKYWNLFSDKVTAEDFNRIWVERLRDEAIIADAQEQENALKLARKHSIYSTW